MTGTVIVTDVSFELEGVTSITFFVIWFDKETFIELPISNLWPVRVKLFPPLRVDDEMLSRRGLTLLSMKEKWQLVTVQVKSV